MGDLIKSRLKWIRLNDVDNKLKLFFGHGRMFGVLFLNKERDPHRTFKRCFECSSHGVHIKHYKDASNVRAGVKIIYIYFDIFKKIILELSVE